MNTDYALMLAGTATVAIVISMLVMFLPWVDICFGCFFFAPIMWFATCMQCHTMLNPGIVPPALIGDTALFAVMLTVSSLYSLYLVWVHRHVTPRCTTYQETA